MPKPKKRPSKNTKAAQKLLKDSKLLSDTKAAQDAIHDGEEFRSSVVTPRTSTANKPRPHKKRG